MELKEQIISFVFSFTYGIIIYFLYKKFYKYFYNVKKIYCLLNTFLFCINLTLIYFKIFYYINNGIINPYFIIITLLTSLYLNSKNFTKKYVKKVFYNCKKSNKNI